MSTVILLYDSMYHCLLYVVPTVVPACGKLYSRFQLTSKLIQPKISARNSYEMSHR